MLLVSVAYGESKQDDAAQIDAGAMVLTKAATISNNISFYSGGIIVQYKNVDDARKIQILNQNGVAFQDTLYDGIKGIVSEGVCIVYHTDENAVEHLGVIDSLKEKEILPCEAIDIRKLSDRYMLVCYMTGEATEEEYFGVFYNNGSVYYNGYGKVLDLVLGRIVPNVEITTSYIDAAAAGNVIVVDGAYPLQHVYNADGILVGSYEYVNAYPDSGIAIQSTGKGINVYDQDMNLVSTLNGARYYDYRPVAGSSDMLLHEISTENGYKYCVTDLQGNAITGEYDRILEINPEGYLYISENGKMKVVDFAGKVLIENYAQVYDVAPGYFIANITGEGYSVYDQQGKKLNSEPLASRQSGLIVLSSNGRVFVLETGNEIAADGYASAQCGSIVHIGDALYDVITGKVVMEHIDDCVSTGSSLYVWDGETKTFTRYIAEFKSLL